MQVCWHLMQTQNCPKFSIGLCSTVSLFLWFGNVACRFHKWWSSGLHGFFLNCRKVRVRSWELRVNRSHLEKHLEKMKLSLDSKVYSSWPFLLILCSKFLILWHDRRGEPRPWICIWNKVIVAWGLRYTSLGRSSLCHGLSSDSHILLGLVLLGPFTSRLQACISQQSWDSPGGLQEALWFSNIVLTMTVGQKVTNWADPGSMC